MTQLSPLSATEENYLKAILKLMQASDEPISTNALAAEMETSPASVTDMLKRLSEKKMIHYEKYKGVRLSTEGQVLATALVRKHRLWETFLVEKLSFTWDEVHDLAEQLEHIRSEELINRLESYLGFPKFDPHGDPIPDRDGNFTYHHQVQISTLGIGEQGVVVGVKDHSPAFLKHVEQLNLILGTKVELLERFEYDQSLRLRVNDKTEQVVTHKVCQNLFVKPQ